MNKKQMLSQRGNILLASSIMVCLFLSVWFLPQENNTVPVCEDQRNLLHQCCSPKLLIGSLILSCQLYHLIRKPIVAAVLQN